MKIIKTISSSEPFEWTADKCGILQIKGNIKKDNAGGGAVFNIGKHYSVYRRVTVKDADTEIKDIECTMLVAEGDRIFLILEQGESSGQTQSIDADLDFTYQARDGYTPENGYRFYGQNGYGAFSPSDALKGTYINDIIQNALKNGEKEITIAPGIYRTAPPAGQGCMIVIKDAEDITVHAENVVMLCARRCLALNLIDCKNVRIRGLYIDYDPLPYTQGEVIDSSKHHPEESESWADILIDEHYPDPVELSQNHGMRRMDILSPETLSRKHNLQVYNNPAARLEYPDAGNKRRVRIFETNIANHADIGDIMMVAAYIEGAPHGIVFQRTVGSSLTDVTLCGAPGFALIDSRAPILKDNPKYDTWEKCQNHCDNLHIIPSPVPPPNAAAYPLRSSVWDGYNGKNSEVGMKIINSDICNVGDDGWSNTSMDFTVVKQESPTEFIIASRGGEAAAPVEAGTILRKALDLPDVKVTAAENITLDYESNNAGISQDFLDKRKGVIAEVHDAAAYERLHSSVFRTSKNGVKITVEIPNALTVGDSVVVPAHQNPHSILERNNFRTTGRILVRSGGDVYFDENVFNAVGRISIWGHTNGAIAMKNITITNNVLKNIGFAFNPTKHIMKMGALYTEAKDRSGNQPRSDDKCYQNITIKGNTFYHNDGMAINLVAAKNVAIEDNLFMDTHFQPPNIGDRPDMSDRNLIGLLHCENVKISGNILDNTEDKPRYHNSGDWLVFISDGCKNIAGAEDGVNMR